MININTPNAIQEDDSKIRDLMNELENNTKYETINYKQLNDSSNSELEHDYVEKDNLSIIHLLYDPLPLDLDDTTNNITTKYTQNNTQMKRFLEETIAVFSRRKMEEHFRLL